MRMIDARRRRHAGCEKTPYPLRRVRVDMHRTDTLARGVAVHRSIAFVGLALALAAPEARAEAPVAPAGHAHHAHHAHQAPTADHADHHANHALLGGGHDHGGGGLRAAVSLGVLAGTYRNPLYEGDYRGAVLGARGSYGRFGLAVSLPAYHLVRNGAAIDGIGDLMLHAHAALVERGAFAAGAMMMASAPTGDGVRGLGMGHVMLMPEVWATWIPSRFAFAVAAGYGHAIGGASAHAEHGGGMWPLVEPMNASEITFSGTGMIALRRGLGIGARGYGAAAIGEGDTRLAAGGRLVWAAGRVRTTAEIMAGMVGEPFGVRGMVETSIHFE